MKRLLFVLLSFVVTGPAFAGLQEDWQAAIDKGVEFVVARPYIEYKPVVLKPKAGQDNLTTTIRSAGAWNQLTFYVADDYAVTLIDPKDCTIEGVGLVNSIGSGFRFTSSKSAGRMWIPRTRVQCKGTAWLIDAANGADFSCMTWSACDTQLADKGWKFVGSNNLDPNFLNCTGSFCKTLFDFTEGGCRFNVTGGGGSHCGTVVDVNPGYEGSATNLDIEVCGTAFNVGSGTGSGLEFSVLDCRDTPVLLRSATNNGRLSIGAKKCKGAKILLTGNTGYVRVADAATAIPITKPTGIKVEKIGLVSAASQ